MTDADLIPDGWTFRFTATGARLDEAADSYRQLGYEVLVRPSSDLIVGGGGPGCGGCGANSADGPVQAIFTRRPVSGDHGDDLTGAEGDER